MTITLVSTPTTGGVNNGGAFSVTKPTGVVDGDILLAFAGNDAGTAGTWTAPSGWSLIRNDNDDGSVTLGMSCYWKRASSEGASYSWNIAGVSGVVAMLAYRGCTDSGSPIDVNAGGPVAGNSTNIDAPSLTPNFNNDMLVCGYCIDNGGTAVSTITVNATLTTETTVVSPTSSQVRVSVGDLLLSSTSATGLKRSTAGASQSATLGVQIALLALAAVSNPISSSGTQAQDESTVVSTQAAYPISDISIGSWV
jgi:hypothetical protein